MKEKAQKYTSARKLKVGTTRSVQTVFSMMLGFKNKGTALLTIVEQCYTINVSWLLLRSWSFLHALEFASGRRNEIRHFGAPSICPSPN
jgi:hypothetical protein